MLFFEVAIICQIALQKACIDLSSTTNITKELVLSHQLTNHGDKFKKVLIGEKLYLNVVSVYISSNVK